MVARLIVQNLVWVGLMGLVLFGTAGTLAWPQAWVFLIESAALGLALAFWLLRNDPALLAERLRPAGRAEPRPWDRLYLAVMPLGFVAWLALSAYGARRAHWSSTPLWLQPIGALLIAACMTLAWRTFRVNSFAAGVVRVQAERAHHVVSTGPYALVRHPLYAAAAMYFLGAPLVLGSWLGLAPAALLIGLVAWRAVREEQVLARDLPGYDAYMSRVRRRLLPFVW